jgi:tRNA A22 N-methylase
MDYLSWWIWYCQKEMALGNGTPHKFRSHEIGLSPYRLQISRMVDGVKPERTDCGKVSGDEKLNECASYSFVIIRGMQGADLTRHSISSHGKAHEGFTHDNVIT